MDGLQFRQNLALGCAAISLIACAFVQSPKAASKEPTLPANMHCFVAKKFGNMRFAHILVSNSPPVFSEILDANMSQGLYVAGIGSRPVFVDVKVSETKCRSDDVANLK